jgi:hypothetical protein
LEINNCVSTSYAEPIAISKNLEKSLFELLEDPSAIFDAKHQHLGHYRRGNIRRT